MKDRVESIANSLKGELFDLALTLHENPEIGMVEFKAVALQKALLEKYGFSVEIPYCGLETAFKASYHGKKPGPNIAYLTEYDALEGIGHACGHNLMAMTGCGAGIILSRLVDEIGGNVFVFGTPAEETIGGKCIMADQGAFDDMDVAMISHPLAYFSSSGRNSALNGYKFEFFGKPSSPAVDPEAGINALDGAINTFNMINALRQHKRDSARIHGILLHGGDATNVVPEYASVLMEVRSPDRNYHKELCERVTTCARAAALGCGARVEISHYEEFFDVLMTNPVLSALHDDQLRLFGVSDIKKGEQTFASSDAGNVSQRCPTIHPYFGITPGRYVTTHTHDFGIATGTELACESALLSAQAMALTGVRLIMEPEHLPKIKAAFEEGLKTQA